MTEAMWIELIRVLPTLIWLGFAVAALVVARRVLTRESHRIARVETPFVSVELAREAIELASRSRAEDPDAAVTAPPSSSDPRPADGVSQRGIFISGDTHTAAIGSIDSVSIQGRSRPPKDPDSATADMEDDPDERAPVETEAPPAEETPPQRMYPPVPPEQRFPVLSDPYHSTTEPVPELPPTDPRPSYRTRPSLPGPAESQRGLRAATRLALSTDLLQGGAILWVDDHHEWNESLVRLFRTAGIKVDTVASTEEAMRAMRTASYDLVITDMRRDNEPAGASAGMTLLDHMVSAGIPTPGIFFSGSNGTAAAVHPRAVCATSSPEELVNQVIDVVGQRRHQQGEGASRRLLWGQR
ncbi:response regulator [Glycomyces arizonensis]|uniref:response regulator n=1 Tax=Glycomyces arizonensis TaxID=256035 RepID=UPI0003F4F1ED|nr:response regulator [Glycomyces arizonensis]